MRPLFFPSKGSAARRRGNGALSARVLSVLAAGFLAWAPGASAQPKLTAVAPDWIQRGATLEVALTGEGLGSVTGFVFNGEAGLSASIVIESNPPPLITVESSSRAIAVAGSGARDRNKSLRAKFTASSDAALGTREVRVLGPKGISGPVNITVGAVPEVAEVEPNNALEQAQVVTLPAAIAGTIRNATEMDHFRLSAKKGDQLVLEVMAQRTGSQLDSSLALLDKTGKELARSEDVRGFDSVLEFTVPEDGEYIAQLRDFQYRGGSAFKYRLFAGVIPFVDYVFPFGGQRGKTVEIAIQGRNLNGAKKMTLNIDPKSPLGRQEIRLNTPRGLSNPIQFDVQEMAEILEAEPNNVSTNATPLTVPGMANGTLAVARDVDRFRVKVGSDQKLICSVEARRYGSELDPLVAVYAGDRLVAQNDDADGSDARVEFDARKDVEYTILLRDLTDRGGDHFGYRLSVRAPSAAAPSLVAKFFPDAVRLHRDGRTHVRCEVARAGFDGPVRVTAVDLPAGVSAEPLVIPQGRNEGDLLLTATPEAVMGTVPMVIVARAVAGGREISQRATAIAPVPNSERAFRSGFLTVFETAPFTVDALTLASSMDQLQTSTLEVLVNRRPGFNAEVKLSAVGFSAGREPITRSFEVKEVTLKTNETTAKIPLVAKVDSEVATRPVLVRAEAMDAGEKVVQFSQPVAVTIAQIPFVLSAAPAKLTLNAPRAGSTNVDEVLLKVKADRRGFTGEIPLTIEGALAGVQIEGTNIPANAAEATVRFSATDKTGPLTNAAFAIQGAAMHKDRFYRHKTSPVSLSVVPPAMEVASTNSAVGPKP